MLETGIKGRTELIVTEQDTAKVYGSGSLMVYATPAMVALMEKTAQDSLAPYLEAGQGTVGISVNIKHTSATPVGMKVYCESILTKVDGRALTFEVKAYDQAGLIGEGLHERFVIVEEKFQVKTDEKLKN